MIKWNPFHRPKRFLLCYSVFLFLLFGLGLLFPSYSASAESLKNVSVDRTLIYTTGAGASPVLQNETYFNTFSNLEGVELVGTATPFVALQGFSLSVPNGSWGDSSYRSNIITVTIGLRQVSNASNQNTLRNATPIVTLYDKNNRLVFAQCDDGVIKDSGTNNHRMDWTCVFNMPEYSAGHGLLWSVGRAVADSSGYPGSSLASVGVYNTLFTTTYRNSYPLYVSSNVVVDKTNDVSTAILEQQTGIMNQQLAEQQETNSLLQQQIDAQQQANDQQQEQYEAEKQEESEREEAATDAQTGSFLGSFGNLLFPFASVFSDLGSKSCFVPTNVNSWLHTPGSKSCPWFPSSVTTAVSSVCLGLSSVVVFGFVIKWLNRSEN